MHSEWNPAKNDANIEKHGIDFEDAISIFAARTVEHKDDRQPYGEERWVALGSMGGLIVVVVYTPRMNGRRIISARLANRKERRLYAEDE